MRKGPAQDVAWGEAVMTDAQIAEVFGCGRRNVVLIRARAEKSSSTAKETV